MRQADRNTKLECIADNRGVYSEHQQNSTCCFLNNSVVYRNQPCDMIYTILTISRIITVIKTVKLF